MRPLVEHFEAVSKRRLLLNLLVVFVVSRAVYFAGGVRYDTRLLTMGWQFLDVELLQNRLLESLYYQHSQPPLFNLFLGLVLKAFPQNYVPFFQATFTLMGFATYLIIFALMRRLGVSRFIAFVLCMVFVVSPSYVLYEQWLFYTMPLMLVLCVSALLLARFRDTGKIGWAAALCLALFLLCGMQSTFHLLYYVLVVAGVIAMQRAQARQIIAVALVPFLLIFAVYAKNKIVFGQFTASTWMGMNLAINRADSIPFDERERLIAAGKISPVALNRPFSRLEAYPEKYGQVPPQFADIPALSQAWKSNAGGGFVNYNHYGFIGIAAQYAQDTRYILTHYPRALLHGGLRGWSLYFDSSSDYLFFYETTEQIRVQGLAVRLYDHLLYGRIPKHGLCLFLLIVLPLLVVFGLRAARNPALPFDATQRVLLLYLTFNILYVACVGNTFNATENNRIRFMTDPFSLILLGVWCEMWRKRRRGTV